MINYNVPMKLLVPVVAKNYGVDTKTYPSIDEVSDDYLFFGSFRTFGGTESTSNGMYTIINTATIDTWYRPDIKANCRIYLLETDEVYEVIGDPEDIRKEHTYLKFKVEKVGA